MSKSLRDILKTWSDMFELLLTYVYIVIDVITVIIVIIVITENVLAQVCALGDLKFLKIGYLKMSCSNRSRTIFYNDNFLAR